jgi:hypothetical protein
MQIARKRKQKEVKFSLKKIKKVDFSNQFLGRVKIKICFTSISQDKNGHTPNSPLKSPSKIPSYQTRPASITPKTRSRSTSKQRLSLHVSPDEPPEPLIKSKLLKMHLKNLTNIFQKKMQKYR